MVAGLFAAMPMEQASTVHTTILAGTAEARLVAFTGNNCSVDGDDGTLLLTLDGATDAALVVALHYDDEGTTDGDDTIEIAILSDGIEVYDGLTFDAGPTGDAEIFSTFDFDGGPAS